MTHREGVLWVSQKERDGSRALLAAAATRVAKAPFGPELHIYCRFELGERMPCRQKWLQLAAQSLRDWPGIAAPEPAPAWETPRELPLIAQLLQEVRTALGRILYGRVVFVIDGLELATTQDPWFISELVHALAEPRVLWVAGGRPSAELGAALQPVAPQMVFPWEPEEVAWPETPNGGPPQPLTDAQLAHWIATSTSFDYYMSRLHGGVTWPWLELQLRRLVVAANDSAALLPWLAFFRQHALALSRGDATTLLQLAMAEAQDSPIAQAAQAWLGPAQWRTPWLRRLHRPAEQAVEPRPVVLGAHQLWVRGLTLAADGKQLASYADDSRVQLWDLDRKELSRELLVPEPQAVIFSATAERILCVQRRLGEWDVTTGACIRRSSQSMSSTVATHPQVPWLAGIDWSQIKLWDLNKQEQTRAIEGLPSRSETAVVHPDGRWLLTGSDDRIVRLWDVTTGTCVRSSTAFASPIRALALHPDGRRLFVISEKGLGVWDLDTGSTLATYAIEFSYRPNACVGSAGRELFVVHQNKVRVYDVETGELCDEIALGDSIRAILAHPDGAHIVTGHHDGTVCMTRLQGARAPRRGHLGGATLLAVDDGAQVVVTGSADRLMFWDLVSDTLKSELPWPPKPHINTLAAAHGVALVLGAENTIEVWELATATLRQRFAGHSKAIRALALSGNGERFVSLGQDALHVWELASGTCVRTWEELPEALRKSSQIALLPDGRQLLVGGDKEPLQLWDLESLQCTATLGAHTDLGGFAVDAAGQRLVTWSARGRVQFWELATQKLLASWKTTQPPSACALTVSGTVIIVDVSGTLSYLKLET